MRIIIAGAGDVGFHLAKLLSYEKQDIVLVDIDKSKLRYAESHIDVATLKGSSVSFSTLEDAGVKKADLLLAVTNSEETNLATAIIGKHLGAKRTVARISNTEFLFAKDKLDLAKLGIDELISPESLAAREIKRLLKTSALTDTFEFDNGLLNMIGINIDNHAPIEDKTINSTSHLNKENDFITACILRNNKTIIPRGNTKFKINDNVYFISLQSGIEKIINLAAKEKVDIKKIMILGGSDVGIHSAKKLSKLYKVKLIEAKRDKCFELVDKLPNTLIINGDGSDVELLEEEGIEDMDAFIAVTGNSETNIISCLVAKNHGVKKTIALIENTDYIHLSQNIGVDTMINKKLIAANFIFRYIRKGEIVSLAGIHGVDAEVLEFEVKKNSKVTKKSIQDLKFPKGALVGGVIRNGKGYIALGDFWIKADDRVVVLSLPECIHDVESFFK
ncbi:MAG: Trk system potassium transporter TrkA [Chitinophagales bacterium]|nr:Trk system potassium transporter TrkA [Chitinophagales bacterium]